MKKKRKRKHWTTKNTHLGQKRKKVAPKEYDNFTPTQQVIFAIIVIGIAIASLIYMAIDTHNVGYDRFPYMPREWIKSLRP